MHTRLACVALALALVVAPAIVLAGGGGADAGGPDTAAASVDTANGSAISLAPANGSNGQYASYAADGELQLHLEELNENAETTAHEVFVIDVTATEPAALSVESDAPGITFYWDDDPTADAAESRTVQPGDSVAVGVRADSYGGIGDGNVTVVAKPVGPGGGGGGDGNGSGDGGNSSGEDGGGGHYPAPTDGGSGEISVESANVSPREITPGESATVTATVRNTGSGAATDAVELSIDGTVVDERTVTVTGNGTEQVRFERTFQQPGEYAVAVGGLDAGTVTVASGGGFVVENASLSPSSIEPGGTTTITADITNRGDSAALFDAELAVGGVVVDQQAVRIGPGETERVSFERTFERRGGYEISISGAEAGTVRVESSTAASMRRYGSEWGWLLGAATVPTLGAAFVAVRRRGRFVQEG